MPYQESWFTAADGLRLRQRCWLPGRSPRAAVVFIHGFSEHSLRHAPAAEALADRGYAVHAIDLRGHGESGGARVWIRSFDEYLDDVERFIAHVREGSSRRPLFLWGNSMGGTIAALLAIERKPALDGLVLSAPFLKMPDHLFPIIRYLAIALGRLVPGLRVVRVGTRYLSRDPQVVADFESDPLNFHGRFPVRTGAELLRAVRRVRRGMESVQTPLLLLHGTADLVTDPDGSRQLHARAASNDKTLRLYPGLYHDLLHEPQWQSVVNDAAEWLDARTPASSP